MEDQSKIDFLWNLYHANKEYTFFSDQKAGTIIAIFGIIVSVIIPKILEIQLKCNNFNYTCYFGIGLILFFFPMTLSLFYAFRVISPNNLAQKESWLFFGTICNNLPKSEDQQKYWFKINFLLNDDNELEKEIASQVWSLSIVAGKKFGNARQSIKWFQYWFLIGPIGLGFMIYMIK
jgi:hypothetical protein